MRKGVKRIKKLPGNSLFGTSDLSFQENGEDFFNAQKPRGVLGSKSNITSSGRLSSGVEIKVNWRVLIVCILIISFVEFIGGLFTTQGVNSEWYNSIKPLITPPGWVFPVVWKILFFLIAVSLYFAWQASKGKQKSMTVLIYGVNLDLNMLWSMLFFGFRNPAAAYYQIGLLWISIALMIIYTWKLDRKASYLLIPYLLWVSFASVLNYLAI